MAVTVFSGWSLEVGGPQGRDLGSLRVSESMDYLQVDVGDELLHTPSLALQRPRSRLCSSCKAQAEVCCPGSILAQDNLAISQKAQ